MKNNARFVEIDAASYHLDYSAQSKTMLWRFRERRRAYKAEFIDCVRPPKKPSDAMIMGTLAHAGMLHPESLEQLYAVYPAEVLGVGGRKGTNGAKEFEAQAAAKGKICLKAEQMDCVKAMIASVQAKLGPWLSVNSIREKPIYWQNPETGIWCRCMPDWIIPKKDVVFCFDLKTTSSAHPEDFERKVRDFGYWFQQSHYSEGVESLFGLPCQFRFVVVEAEFPHTCAVEELAHVHMSDAQSARLTTLRELAHCLTIDDFSEPWEKDVRQIVLRPGAFDTAA